MWSQVSLEELGKGNGKGTVSHMSTEADLMWSQARESQQPPEDGPDKEQILPAVSRVSSEP